MCKSPSSQLAYYGLACRLHASRVPGGQAFTPRTRRFPTDFSILRSAQLFTIQSAPASRSSESVAVVLTATTFMLADFPDRMPAGASSITTQFAAENPSFAAPVRYGSGCGFPFRMSEAVTNSLGAGRPAALIRTSARGRVHEVTIVHRSCGRLVNNSNAPGRGT